MRSNRDHPAPSHYFPDLTLFYPFFLFSNHKQGSPKGTGTPVIAFFANGDDELIVPYADGANQMREDYQFYHVYGDNVSKFGGKVGELRLYQKPHLQSKFEKPVSNQGFMHR